MILSDAFLHRMQEMLRDEFEAFKDSYEKPRKNSLRVCSLKIKSNEFEEQAPFKVEPVPWVKNGFFYNYEDRVSAHPYYKAGVYYLQEASAMTVADRFPVERGEKVLDLCAAPGGKATELAGKLDNTGLLMANEVSPSRVKALLYNLESCGAANIIVTNEQPFRLEKKYTEYFDKVLVDAPCSGEGMFRKSEEAVSRWTPEKPEEFAALQKTILKSAAAMLRPGGLLMYSTCTFSAEEDEKNVSWLLHEFKEFEILDIEGYEGFEYGRPEFADGDERVKKAVRIWPHKMDGEGHFLALFRKNVLPGACSAGTENMTGSISAAIQKDASGSVSGKRKKERKAKEKVSQGSSLGTPFTKEEKRLFFEFASHMHISFDTNRLFSRSGKAYLLPEACPDLDGIKYLRTGLLLGEFKKERFEPSQALAFYLKPDTFDNVLDLSPSDERVKGYLRGETVPVSEEDGPLQNGWILIACGGFSLGFGKMSDRKIKNKLSVARREMA